MRRRVGLLMGEGMPRAYSGDLRIRVIGAVEGGLATGGRGIDGDRLGWSMAADGEFGGQVTEEPQPLAAGGACVVVIGTDRGGSRSHPGGDPRAVGGARDPGGGQLDLAVLRSARHQL